MKRTLCLIASAVMILCGFSVSAEDAPCVYLDAQSGKENRLFDVYVMCENFSIPCTGVVCLTYDSDMIEFCSAQSECGDIEVFEYDDCVDIAFLSCPCINAGKHLVNLTFKGTSIGQTAIDVKMREYVCSDANNVDIKTRGLDVDISKTGVRCEYKNIKSSSVKAEKSKADKSKTENKFDTEKSKKISHKASVDSVKLPDSKNEDNLYIAGISAAGFAVLFLVVYLAYKYRKKMK